MALFYNQLTLEKRGKKMKKTFSLICILAALICGAVFTGCDLDEDDFVAPKDTWVYKEGKSENSYVYSWTDAENKEKKVKFDVYINYATNESSIKFKGEKDETAQRVFPGLNVILVPNAETSEEKSNVQLLFDIAEASGIENIAIFKAFSTEPEVGEDDSSTSKQKIGTAVWTSIYNLNHFEKMGNNSITKIVANYSLIADTKNLKWKRVVYDLLGNKLLGE